MRPWRANRNNRRPLSESVVVVTGAASGIGRATVEAFVGRGATVHGADVDEPGLERLAAGLGEASRRFMPHVVDVRDAEAMEGLAERVYGVHGRVDVLHNNAGVVVVGRVETLTLADWRRAVDINLYGVIHGVHAFVPRMIRQGGGGHVVNTASAAGLLGFPLCAPYSASKFGVVGLSEALGGELAASGIRVTALCPGMVKTALIGNGSLWLPGTGKAMLEDAMSKHALTPEAVAAEVLRVVEQGQGGILALGLGTRPLWWARRLSVAGYQAAMGAISARVLGRLGRAVPEAGAIGDEGGPHA